MFGKWGWTLAGTPPTLVLYLLEGGCQLGLCSQTPLHPHPASCPGNPSENSTQPSWDKFSKTRSEGVG